MTILTASRPAIGLFGGTFDPVHIGHLRTALEIKELLALDEMRLLPVNEPPHRPQPGASAAHRLAMLQRALHNSKILSLDDRELRRAGPSYTVDTLRELRAELGEQVAICLCVGLDSLISLDSWHQWQQLPELAHLVVAVRPGWEVPDSGPAAELLAARQVTEPDALRAAPAGAIFLTELTLLPISATDIRAIVASGRSPRYLLPDSVLTYIREHHLYLA